MDSAIKQRLIRVIGWGGYCAAVICFLFGLYLYVAVYAYIFGERWDESDGVQLMLWGVGLFVVTAAVLYVLDGRTPFTGIKLPPLSSPSFPHAKFAWLAGGAAAVGFALFAFTDPGRSKFPETGFWLVLFGVPLAVLFIVMALVVKRR